MLRVGDMVVGKQDLCIYDSISLVTIFFFPFPIVLFSFLGRFEKEDLENTCVAPSAFEPRSSAS